MVERICRVVQGGLTAFWYVKCWTELMYLNCLLTTISISQHCRLEKRIAT